MTSKALELAVEYRFYDHIGSEPYGVDEPDSLDDRQPSFIAVAFAGAIMLIAGFVLLRTSTSLGGGVMILGILLLLGSRAAIMLEEHGDEILSSNYPELWPYETYDSGVEETSVDRELARRREIEEIVRAVKTTVRVRCRHCGILNEDNAKTCESCGAPL
jgi:hypothetical protein